MTKKFLGIFKRDKTVFSNEELEWQKKWVRIIAHVWCIVLFLLWLISFFLLVLYTKNMEMIILYIDIDIAIFLFLGVVINRKIFSKNFSNIKSQLWRNEKKECIKAIENRQKEELGNILYYIAKGDFSELIIDWRKMDYLFRTTLLCGVLKIIPDKGGVKVSMSIPGKDIPSCWIDSDELLEYFDVKDKEEE